MKNKLTIKFDDNKVLVIAISDGNSASAIDHEIDASSYDATSCIPTFCSDYFNSILDSVKKFEEEVLLLQHHTIYPQAV